MKTEPTEFKKYLDTEIGKRYLYVYLAYDIIAIIVIEIAVFTTINLSILPLILTAVGIVYFISLMNSYRLYLKKQKRRVEKDEN